MKKVDNALCFVNMQKIYINLDFTVFFSLEATYFSLLISVFFESPKVVREPKKLAISPPIVAFWHSRYVCILVIPNFRSEARGRTVERIGKCH